MKQTTDELSRLIKYQTKRMEVRQAEHDKALKELRERMDKIDKRGFEYRRKEVDSEAKA
jgi:hypothetical protein